MNKTFLIANAIGFIDDDLILEAEEPWAAPKQGYLRYAAAAAACLCVAGGAVIAVNARRVPESAVSQGSLVIPESVVSPTRDTDKSVPGIAPCHPTLVTSDVYFNEETSEEVGGARLYFDPEIYDEVKWDNQDLLVYFGRELTPAYIPEGLIPSEWNESGATVFVKKGGEIVYDRVGLSFYHDYYEDGSPKLTDDVAATKGFSVTASKLGMPFECGVYNDHGDKKTTDVGGTEVVFSHRSVPYGPYDPETHEPSGFYDMYVAEFSSYGIYYRVVTQQLESHEIVKIAESVINGQLTMDN